MGNEIHSVPRSETSSVRLSPAEAALLVSAQVARGFGTARGAENAYLRFLILADGALVGDEDKLRAVRGESAKQKGIVFVPAPRWPELERVVSAFVEGAIAAGQAPPAWALGVCRAVEKANEDPTEPPPPVCCKHPRVVFAGMLLVCDTCEAELSPVAAAEVCGWRARAARAAGQRLLAEEYARQAVALERVAAAEGGAVELARTRAELGRRYRPNVRRIDQPANSGPSEEREAMFVRPKRGELLRDGSMLVVPKEPNEAAALAREVIAREALGILEDVSDGVSTRRIAEYIREDVEESLEWAGVRVRWSDEEFEATVLAVLGEALIANRVRKTSEGWIENAADELSTKSESAVAGAGQEARVAGLESPLDVKCRRCASEAGKPCCSVGPDSYSRGAPLQGYHAERYAAVNNTKSASSASSSSTAPSAAKGSSSKANRTKSASSASSSSAAPAAAKGSSSRANRTKSASSASSSSTAPSAAKGSSSRANRTKSASSASSSSAAPSAAKGSSSKEETPSTTHAA